MSATSAIVVFVVAIIVSIMIHEWGHFSTARRFGMRADKFFLGFGPTLWSTRRGETEYGVKALPAGGFVRVRGMGRGEPRRPGIAQAWVDGTPAGDGGPEPESLEGEERRDDDWVAPAPDRAWARLDALLDERGTPAATRAAIVGQVREADPTTPAEAVRAVDRAVDDHVPAVADDVGATARERLSSLHHRLRHGDRGRFFHDRPAWQRAIVLVAGSFWHFVIAIVLFFGGLVLLPQGTGEVTNEIGAVQAGSAAEAAGLEVGDRVLAIDGVTSDDFLELRDLIQASLGQPIEVTVGRGEETLALVGTPAAGKDAETGEVVGQLGFVPAEGRERLGVGDAAWETFIGPQSIPAQVGLSLAAVGDVFGPEGIGQLFGQISGVEERSPEGGISMVGGAAMTGQGVAAAGVMFLVLMVVSVNVFIGVLNLLPLPPLDGGHLAVLGIEVVTNRVRGWLGRPTDFTVDPRTVAAVALPVLLVLGTVGLGLIWLDIVNPIQLP